MNVIGYIIYQLHGDVYKQFARTRIFKSLQVQSANFGSEYPLQWPCTESSPNAMKRGLLNNLFVFRNSVHVYNIVRQRPCNTDKISTGIRK
jgi:CubicO group peptidase (beta-lactamase class C family)